VNWLRVFFVGGLTSYRALFHWLSPWIFVPMLVIAPTFQLLFFAYLGRASAVESDSYFVVGNALLAAALPGLWGMSHSIAGERRSKTLGMLLSSPASRLALFLGRGLPTVVNAFVVSAFCFVVGAVLLEFDLDPSAVPALLVAIAACSFSCAALGLSVGALGLRGRNVTVIDNLLLAALLLLCGVNVPLERLPEWMQAVGTVLPLTHGVEAAREIVAGATVGQVRGPLLAEFAVGAGYALGGAVLLRLFEYESRRTASLETF
jgi:ABC-2 type transport system permease protein